MRRRDFMTLVGGAAAALSVSRPMTARAQEAVGTLQRAKRDYEKISRPSETARSDYITRLIRMREKAAKTDEWQAIDAEIKRHPAPADSKNLSSLLVGKWQSPRHDYLYRADGTWTMLPAEQDGVQSTHGTWRIEGNRFFDTASLEPVETSRYTIILITKKDLVFSDDTDVFYETRLK